MGSSARDNQIRKVKCVPTSDSKMPSNATFCQKRKVKSAKLVFNPILRNTDLRLGVPYWELAPEIMDSVKAGIQSGTGTTISREETEIILLSLSI